MAWTMASWFCNCICSPRQRIRHTGCRTPSARRCRRRSWPMADLFTQEPSAPLAEALRPKTLDEVVGQSHLLGEGKPLRLALDRKSTRLNSSHLVISYAVFCLKKKTI